MSLESLNKAIMIVLGSFMVAKLFCESVGLFICFHMISHFGNILKVIRNLHILFFYLRIKYKLQLYNTFSVFMMNRIKCLEDWGDILTKSVTAPYRCSFHPLVGGAGGLASLLCLFMVTMGWHTLTKQRIAVCSVFIYFVNSREDETFLLHDSWSF